MFDDTSEYYAMRAKQERELAASSDDATVAAIHNSLARDYERILAERGAEHLLD